jgi:hypothetical protein
VVSDGYQSAPKPLQKALPFPLKQPCTTAFREQPKLEGTSVLPSRSGGTTDNMCNDGRSHPYQNNFYLKVQCEGAEVEVVVLVDRNTVSTFGGWLHRERCMMRTCTRRIPLTPEDTPPGGRLPLLRRGRELRRKPHTAHITQSRAFPNRAAFRLAKHQLF